MAHDLTKLVSDVRGCRLCEGEIPAPRPVLRISETARVLIAGQAPGTRVHESGKPFTDSSGDRLRDWMGVEENVFYDESRIAILPMGFCFPGLDAKGGDKPPRPVCARTWRVQLLEHLPNLKLTLVIGGYAMKWHLPQIWTGAVTTTVSNWKDAGEAFMPLPHPSWRNNAWIKKHPWFSDDVLPALKHRIQTIL